MTKQFRVLRTGISQRESPEDDRMTYRKIGELIELSPEAAHDLLTQEPPYVELVTPARLRIEPKEEV